MENLKNKIKQAVLDMPHNINDNKLYKSFSIKKMDNDNYSWFLKTLKHNYYIPIQNSKYIKTFITEEKAKANLIRFLLDK